MSGKQRSYTKIAQSARIQSILRGILSGEHFPTILILEPTSRCNMRCTFCLCAKFKSKVSDMPMKLFKKIMQQSMRHRLRESIIFSGKKGEPLLHPRIVEMVKLAKKGAYKVYLHTNGLSLKRSLSRSFIQSGLDGITIGLDGAKKKTYESIRIGSSFDKVIKNIKAFIDQKKRSKSKIQVTIRVVSIEANKKEIPQIKKMWRGIVDRVEILADIRKMQKRTKKIPCFSLWSLMMINSDGGVNICGYETDSNREIGNINEKSIQQIWEGKDFNYFRECHLKNKFEKLVLCQKCDG